MCKITVAKTRDVRETAQTTVNKMKAGADERVNRVLFTIKDIMGYLKATWCIGWGALLSCLAFSSTPLPFVVFCGLWGAVFLAAVTCSFLSKKSSVASVCAAVFWGLIVASFLLPLVFVIYYLVRWWRRIWAVASTVAHFLNKVWHSRLLKISGPSVDLILDQPELVHERLASGIIGKAVSKRLSAAIRPDVTQDERAPSASAAGLGTRLRGALAALKH